MHTIPLQTGIQSGVPKTREILFPCERNDIEKRGGCWKDKRQVRKKKKARARAGGERGVCVRYRPTHKTGKDDKGYCLSPFFYLFAYRFLTPYNNGRNQCSDLGPDSAEDRLPKSAASCFVSQLTASRFFFLRFSFESMHK